MSIAIVVPEISARLSYILEWIFTYRLRIKYELHTTLRDHKKHPFVITYGDTQGNITIPDAGLLREQTIRGQQIAVGSWNELPVLFADNNQNHTIPFDFFSAVFFLISRYEEYLPFTPDKHQRFPATKSILFEHGLLERPIIDEWIAAFGSLLKVQGVKVQDKTFTFLPTYDIDIAWSYKNKGLKRIAGGYLKDVATKNFAAVQQRTAVLRGHLQDPFDSFDVTDELHKARQLKPLYFVLAAKQNGPFDKHILPANKNMKILIKRLATQYETGMHPSYDASRNRYKFDEEQKILAGITGKEVKISRQHYIRFTLPETYRMLIDSGISKDFSMGYGTHLGFRAGTSHPFHWYDLEAEQQSPLLVFPFCFMDTTAHYELKLPVTVAFERLAHLKKQLEHVNGLLITVFHNFSLGTDSSWKGWQEAYTHFVKN